MQIKQYDLKSIQKRFPPKDNGWVSTWAGVYYSKKFRSHAYTERVASDHKVETGNVALNAGNFESMCVLSILEDIHKKEITFMELGAGWGAQTADVVGVIRNKIVNTEIESVDCFAIEAEPFHFKWLQEMFLYNGIKAVSLFGAMDQNVGIGKFYAKVPSGDSYGQSLHDNGNLTVPTFSIDYLMDLYDLNHVDIIHMDVQGVEWRVLQGANKAISEGLIDYFVIGTHGDHLHKPILNTLKDYDCLVDMFPKSGMHEFEGFDMPINMAVDGLMIFKRK